MTRLNRFSRRLGERIRAFPPRVDRAASASEAVVLLHGLGRTRRSLFVLERVLRRAGYFVVNRTYPSKNHEIDALADIAVGGGVAAARAHAPVTRIHFATHSMGGILLRAWFAERSIEGFGRAVMLAPPNRGTELVDQMSELGVAEWMLGPAGAALGTGQEDAPQRLPDLALPYGVIAGATSMNPATSAILNGEDDGKVSVASTMLPGAVDHLTLPVTHTLMMNEPMTIWQCARFLRRGAFDHEARLNRLPSTRA